jgi:hypothetical protein
MILNILEKELTLDLYGFSGIAMGKDYAGTAFKLMDKMWQIVKTKELRNSGLNTWVYESNDIVFAGVELFDPYNSELGLEHKVIVLAKYAHFKHIGPYNLIKQSGEKMRAELKRQGYNTVMPYIEIYGHWTMDETKSETDLLMCLR